jgi:hypothetical protein
MALKTAGSWSDKIRAVEIIIEELMETESKARFFNIAKGKTAAAEAFAAALLQNENFYPGSKPGKTTVVSHVDIIVKKAIEAAEQYEDGLNRSDEEKYSLCYDSDSDDFL